MSTAGKESLHSEQTGWGRRFLDFLLPRTCGFCGARLTLTEHEVCAVCIARLPRVQYRPERHGAIERLFWHHLPVVRATSYFYYHTSEVRHAIHEQKYYQRPQLAEALAALAAQELTEQCHFFDGIDAIVPVPLHWYRQLRRGYNQSDYIARGISSVTGIPVWTDVLRREASTKTQTQFGHFLRKLNVEGAFRLVHPERTAGRHLLLVDDVLTTGSTLIACGKALTQCSPDTSVSVFTLAYAGELSDYSEPLEQLPFDIM